ncbi:MAG: helix-turn-helix transcriptional regulator [Pseudomonadota bacterium]
MRHIVGGDSVLVTAQYPGAGRTSLLASNLDDRFLAEYARGWWAKDGWMLGALSRQRGRAYLGSDLVPDTEWMRSEIYNELVKSYADCRHCLGTIVDVEDGRCVVGFHRPATAPDFTEADRRILQGLLPHLGQALRLGERLARRDEAHHLTRLALDALSFGLIVVDSSCRPLLMNRRAERCLALGDGLMGGRSQTPLRAGNIAQTRGLHRLVDVAAARDSPLPGAMQIGRSHSDTPLTLLVSPLVGATADLFALRRRAALLFVLDIEPVGPSVRTLRSLFGLTPAEADLAERLGRGAHLKDIASERDVHLETLRSQLKAIFQKTDTDRQSALVRLLTSLSVRAEGE